MLSLVTMTQWTHLFPSRTEKLSTVVAKVAKARIARCWALFFMLKKCKSLYNK